MSTQHAQYVLLFLVLLVNDDWFEFMCYTFLLKPPVLMRSCCIYAKMESGIFYCMNDILPRQAVYVQVEVAYSLAGVCRCVSQVFFSVPHRYPRDGWWRPAQWPAWSCPHCRGHHQHLQTVRQSDSQISNLSQTDRYGEKMSSLSSCVWGAYRPSVPRVPTSLSG